MSTPIGSRRFSEELITMVGRRVSVTTGDGRQYQGDLLGIDDKLNLVLGSVIGASPNSVKVVLNGMFVKELLLLEKPFDLRSLNDRLARAFPGMTRLREDIGAIIVMDTIKVTDKGVVEGGDRLSATRVKQIFDEFARETGQTKKA
jgi:small nuclear ribonucleoprotein (snRNP)-like protein